MCIGIWTLEHPDYALILCTNRDEFLDRPTQNAHFHSFGADDDDNTDDGDHQHQVLSGRDKLAGGSWFGINRTGRVAMLTNIKEPPKCYDTSRGSLVSSFLLSNTPAEETIPPDAQFAGFNLLLLTPTLTTDPAPNPNTPKKIQYSALLITNHGGGRRVTSRSLSFSERSCGAISNGIDSPGTDNLWPKLQHATAHFPAIVNNTLIPSSSSSSASKEDKSDSSRCADPTDVELVLVDRLFELLAWQPQDPNNPISHRSEAHRNTIQVSPPPPMPSFPTTTNTSGSNLPTTAPYGTRLSTILLVRNNGHVLFIERDMWKLSVLLLPGNERGGGVGGVAGTVPVKPDPPTERKFSFKLDL